jgi:hypothetical protein
MCDTKPQTADGEVLFHFAMSLDGFVACPATASGCTATPAASRSASTGSANATPCRP